MWGSLYPDRGHICARSGIALTDRWYINTSISKTFAQGRVSDQNPEECSVRGRICKKPQDTLGFSDSDHKSHCITLTIVKTIMIRNPLCAMANTLPCA